MDISSASVEKSTATNKKEIGKRCRIIQGDAKKLPFKDGELTLATAFETVYFWKDIEACFIEIKRVLKERGRFAVINDPGDPNKHWEDIIPGMTSYTPEEIKALMEKVGFTGIRITRNKNMYCVVGNA